MQFDTAPSELIEIAHGVSGSSSFDNTNVSEPKFSDLYKGVQLKEVPLEAIAWGRSGDKGNKANIGIIARHPSLLPYIWETFSENRIAKIFSHFLENEKIDRHYLPGISGVNFVLHDVPVSYTHLTLPTKRIV